MEMATGLGVLFKDMKLNNLEIYERIFTSHWFLTSYNGIGFVFDFPKIGGGNYISQIIYLMENKMCRYVFDKEEFENTAKFTANKLINNHVWRRQVYKKIDYYTKNYFAQGEKLCELNLKNFSSEKLVKLINKLIVFQHFHQTYAVLANGVVLDGRNHFSNKIREELKKHIKDSFNFEKYWTLLTQVPKMSLRQEKDFAMAKLAKHTKGLANSKILAKLKQLHLNYCWLDYNNMGPETSFEKFKLELVRAGKNNKKLKLNIELKRLARKQRALIKKLKLNKRAKFLISLARGVIEQKAFRKDVQYHGFFCYGHLFKEIAKRKNIKNWQLLFYLFPWEVENFIKTNKITTIELEQRRKLSVFIVSKSGLKILTGKKALPLAKKIKNLELNSKIKEAKGQCAFEGKVIGKVKIIQTPDDIKKMQKGNILLSQATSPDLLPAMHKAGAIVTNTGGLICHAAITSRELKIPCIVGTANATLIFKDGDMVEVDASEGVIRKIR